MINVAKRSKGFTLVELMMASAVFSIVLLICTTALIQIGRVYYKGIVSTRTQEAARSIIDELSRAIQFDGGTVSPVQTIGSGVPPSPSNFFCIDDLRYSFVRSRKLLDSGATITDPANETLRALVSDDDTACSTGQNLDNPPGLDAESKEHVAPNMRIAKLAVCLPGMAPTAECPAAVIPPVNSGLYYIAIRLVYGDADLLCSQSVAGDCSSTVMSTSLANSDITCKSIRAGSQFCAVSELSTTVQKRVE